MRVSRHPRSGNAGVAVKQCRGYSILCVCRSKGSSHEGQWLLLATGLHHVMCETPVGRLLVSTAHSVVVAESVIRGGCNSQMICRRYLTIGQIFDV